MSHRVDTDVSRSTAVEIEINGTAVSAYEGESVATAIMASGSLAMTRDRHGGPRGPFCNMGVCYDCVVSVTRARSADAVRVRACLTDVRAGMRIRFPDRNGE